MIYRLLEFCSTCLAFNEIVLSVVVAFDNYALEVTATASTDGAKKLSGDLIAIYAVFLL